MILKIFILFLILGIIPFGIGLIPSLFIDKSKWRPSMVYLSGFIVSLALFQMVSVPIIILVVDGFKIIVPLYLTLSSLTAIAGVVLTVLNIKKNGVLLKGVVSHERNISHDEIIEWIIFGILLVFQVVMMFLMASFDGDDAYYVVQSLLTTETDTLYRILPYTGLSTSIDLRHSLATVPVWIAYIARLSGLHSTIVAHSVMGFVLLPVTYMIYYLSGRILFRKEMKRLPIFMIFVSIMHLFGNVSIYTNATFLMTRTWQGKAMLANIAIPAVIWLLMAVFDTEVLEKENRLGFWITLFSVNIVAAMCSTSSVFLIAMLIGISGVVLALRNRNLQMFLRLIITCVPLVVSGVLYLLL